MEILGIVIIFLIIFVIDIITGSVLVRRGHITHFRNLVYIGFSNLSVVLVYLNLILFETQIPYLITILISHLLVVLFVVYTYYIGRKSPLRKILLFLLVFWAIPLVLNLFIDVFKIIDGSVITRLIETISIFLISFIVFGWYTYCAYHSYQTLKNKPIEPWVLRRLKLVIFSSILFMFIQFPDILRLDPSVLQLDFTNPFSMSLIIIQSIILTLAIFIEFAAWVMPKPFKKLFSSNMDSTNEKEKRDNISERTVNSPYNNDELSETEILNLLRGGDV